MMMDNISSRQAVRRAHGPKTPLVKTLGEDSPAAQNRFAVNRRTRTTSRTGFSANGRSAKRC
ncbi:hypothetical protein X728_26365 [Mesorhizobium sp. L103C120A0]|nr:hypothetical protein X728_26365 [Mesorhizobium sp. L103C120A0]